VEKKSPGAKARGFFVDKSAARRGLVPGQARAESGTEPASRLRQVANVVVAGIQQVGHFHVSRPSLGLPLQAGVEQGERRVGRLGVAAVRRVEALVAARAVLPAHAPARAQLRDQPMVDRQVELVPKVVEGVVRDEGVVVLVELEVGVVEAD